MIRYIKVLSSLNRPPAMTVATKGKKSLSVKNQDSSRGFTLIELLVVIAIVGILATTAIVNFGKNEDRDVRAEKDRLTSFIREVQNKALAGEKVSTASGKVCGFGVSLVSGNLQAYYANTSGSTSLDDPCSAVNNTYASNSSNNLEKFIPRNGVSMSSSGTDIFFMSPNGDIYRDGSTVFSNPIIINLTKTGLGTNIPVNIDQSGRVY